MQKFFNSSRDKESDGTQFLQIGVTTTKLSPINTPEVLYEMHFLHEVL